MIDQILGILLSSALAGLTSIQSLILGIIILIAYLVFIIFKKKLPFIITTKNTLNLIVKSIRTTDKDIIDINAIYSVQLDGIIVSGIKTLMASLWQFIHKQLNEQAPMAKAKEHALIILSLLITYDLRDAIKQLARENGFLDMNKDELYEYSKSKEFILYDIIERNFNSRYYFNSEENLYSLINNELYEVAILKNQISESYFNLFKNIQTHLNKREEKTNELMSHNEDTIKEFI